MDNKNSIVKKTDKEKNDKKSKTNRKTESNVIVAAVLIICIIFAAVIISFEYNRQMKQQSLFNYNKKKVLDRSNLTNNQKKILGLEDHDLSISDNEKKYKLYDNTDEFTKKFLEKENKKIEETNYTNNYKIYDNLTDEQKKKSEVIPRKEIIPKEKIEDLKEEIKIEDEIPRKYSLSDHIQLKVENQESFGLCWDFAATKSIETFMALHENKFYDFSEIHADYLISDLFFGSREIHEGATFSEYKAYLKKFGPVNSENLEYRDYEKEEYLNFPNIKPVVEVVKTVSFPDSFTQKEGATQEEINEFRNLLKSHIMKNGSIFASVATPYAGDYYNTSTDSEFYDGNTPLSSGMHAVSIVGWDDDYSKDNFVTNSGSKPKNDGAYLALNSWGDYGPGHGYFYISYEDVLVEGDLYGILSVSKDDYINLSSIKSEIIRNYFYDSYSNYIKNIDGEDYIRPIDFEDKGSINLSNTGLNDEDLEDLKIFSDMSEISLDLSDNNLTDLTPLSELKNKYSLHELYIANNNISDLTPLKDFKNISYLDARENNISDLTPLMGMKKLNSINISNNQVSDLTPLKNAEKLLYIAATNNEINSIDSFGDLNVSSLDISDNPVNWEEGTLNNSSISFLLINNTSLNSLNYLKGLSSLKILSVGYNPLESLEGIENLKLYSFDVSGNNIKDWSLIKNLKIIENDNEMYSEPEVTINASNSGLEDITIFNDIDITKLILDNNRIKNLSSLNNNKINYLSIINNRLEDISKFDASNISYIDLSRNPQIKGLESIKNVPTVILSENGLSDLTEVKKLTGVLELDLSKNNIKDLSALNDSENLYTLSVEENKNLDISTIPEHLVMLNAKDCNTQKDVEFSDVKNLIYLNLSGENKYVNIDSFIGNSNKEDEIDIAVYGKTVPYSDIEKTEELSNISLIYDSVSMPYNSDNPTIELPYDSWLQKRIRQTINVLKSNDVKIGDIADYLTITGDNPYIEDVGALSIRIDFYKQN